MNSRDSFFLFLVLLVSCSVPVQQNQTATSPSSCSTDADCVCGGIDIKSGDCFTGNKEYSRKYVDNTKQCPDFCGGIAGNLETKCVGKICRNVARKPEQIGCREDAKICADGTAVARVPPDCEFAPCPTKVDTGSFSHWLCEDGTWKENAEDCFVNTCVDVTDCQMMGVSGICGPTKIAAPKEVHKAPVFYPFKCGSENCTTILAKCPSFDTLHTLILNVDCQESECVLVKNHR